MITKRSPFLIAVIAAAAVFVCQFLPAQTLSVRTDIGESGLVPPPRLIAPSADVINLYGKDSLEFKWSPHEGDPTKREYYDFRLYKGTQAFAAHLIYKVRVPRNVWAICIKADFFEEGGRYTCTLRQVYLGLKSRRTFQTFTVTNSPAASR